MRAGLFLLLVYALVLTNYVTGRACPTQSCRGKAQPIEPTAQDGWFWLAYDWITQIMAIVDYFVTNKKDI